MRGVNRGFAGLAVLASAIAGCGGSSEPHAEWAGPPELRPREGILVVETFRQHAEAVDEDWESDPEALAREFLQRDEGETSVDGDRVTILHDGLEDDSIRAERWVLELVRDEDVWQLVSARWEQRCHADRGHQVFSPELCL